MNYRDHFHAGEVLADLLQKKKIKAPVVFGIPSGGVPVALEISNRLPAPFHLLVVHKIGMADNPEVAIGSVTSGGHVVLDTALIASLNYPQELVRRLTEKAQGEVSERLQRYGVEEWKNISLRKNTAIIVDDGLATGYTMLAAIETVEPLAPARLIAAIPTAHGESVRLVERKGVEVICPDIRRDSFFAVSQAYELWKNWTTEEIKELLCHYVIKSGERDGKT